MIPELTLDPSEGGWTAYFGDIKFLVKPTDEKKAASHALPERNVFRLLVTLPSTFKDLKILIGGVQLRPSQFEVSGKVLTTTFRTHSEFGRLSIEIKDGVTQIAICNVRIRPLHLDADNDFSAMQRDIERFSYSLVFAEWRRAVVSRYPDLKTSAGLSQWIALLNGLWQRINVGLREISLHPDEQLVQRSEVVPAQRAQRVTAAGARWLSRNTSAWEYMTSRPVGFALNMRSGFAAPARVLTVRRDVTYDTPANRFVRARLEATWHRARRIIANATRSKMKGGGPNKSVYVERLRVIEASIGSRLRESWLADAKGSLTSDPSLVHVLQADPRYRDVLTSLTLLNAGIVGEVKGNAVEIGFDETWRVYEYWVYRSVLDYFISTGWICEQQNAVRYSPDDSGVLRADLQRGKDSKTIFRRNPENSISAEQVTLYYQFGVSGDFPKDFSTNPNRSLSALTGDRVLDILLKVSQGSNIRYYVIDPKYRVEQHSSGKLICATSAIEDMHVYRDSIGSWSSETDKKSFERVLAGAYAVFPASEENTYSNGSYLGRMTYGIAAIAALPSNEGKTPPQLHALLNYIVNESFVNDRN